MNASSLPTASRLLFDELLLQPNLRLRIGEHVVDLGALRLATRPDHPRLTSKAAAVLIELVRHAGDTVTREQLLERVWADRVTTPDVLTQAIKELRRAFCDDAKPSRYIETIPKVGYRLLTSVSLLDGEQPLTLVPRGSAPAVNDPELDDAGSLAATAAVNTRRRQWLWPLLAAAIAALSLGVLLWPKGAIRGTASAWRVSDVLAVTSDPGAERRPSVSPDGQRVAYTQLDPATGVDRIVLRAIGQSESIFLTSKATVFEEMAAWSPDGSQIAFERLGNDSCTVFIASSLGGAEREIGACHDFNTHYFDWTPDGKALITAEHQQGAAHMMVLVRWDLATGDKQPLQYARNSSDQDLEAHYSPDGRWIAFRRGLAPNSDLCVMSAAGGEVRQLTQLHSRIRGLSWTADSNSIVFASNHDGHFALYGVELQSRRLFPLNLGEGEYPSSARAANAFVYQIPRRTNRLAQVTLGQEKPVALTLAKSTGSDGSPALSPGDDRIAFISDRSSEQQVWLYDVASSAATALTDFHGALLVNPAWRADGKRLLVTVRGTERPGLIEIDLASRRQRRITSADQDVFSGNYGPDPDSFIVVLGAAEKHNDLVLLEHVATEPASTVRAQQTLLASNIEHTEFDPAARLVYYTRDGSQHGLFVRDLAGGDERLVTSEVESSIMDGWRIVDGRIWYVSRVAWKPFDLLEFDPSTQHVRSIAHLETELHDVNFSVTSARDRVVVVPLSAEDTDVGAFKLTSAATPQAD